MNEKKRKFLMIPVSDELEKKVREFSKKRGLSKSAFARFAIIKEMEGKD